MYGPSVRGPVVTRDGVEYSPEEWNRKEIKDKLSYIAKLLEQLNSTLRLLVSLQQ